MQAKGWVLAVAMMAALPAVATTIPHLDEYAKNATSTTNVDLDKNMLGLAGGLMDKGKEDQAAAKQVLNRMQAIHVHTFEYDRDDAYDRKSVQDVRNLFGGGEWSHIISVHEKRGKGDDTDIFVHMVNGAAAGMMIISAEPRELTFVELEGPLSVDDLLHLHGKFGIPGDVVGERRKPKEKDKQKLEAVPDSGLPDTIKPMSAVPDPVTPPALNYSGHTSLVLASEVR